MMSGNPHCFGHPTKVTFTFSEKCLKNENPNFPPYSSYWSASPYGDNSAYNIQTWLAHKMKTQRQKLKLEKAVQRAERKLQIEYDKQMELKRKAADERFKMWLKSKGFANQSPVMLYRGPHHCLPNTSPSSTTPVATESKRPKTARVRSVDTPNSGNNQKTKGKLRPRSASATGNRKQITSTLDTKVTKPKPACKALGQDDYMKMRHLAGKRYKKLKSEKSGFQCEDQLLRKLQDLDWEEKCIKNKMVFSEKEHLDKVRAKALKGGKKKLKFKGDVITVEVEEIDSNADVDITFEEVDDKCSDIGCIEKEGVDFHIESRETIDLSDKPDEEPCRPMTAEPPKIECEVVPPSRPARPKSAKPQSSKRDVAKQASVDSKTTNAKESEPVSKKQDVEKEVKKGEDTPKVEVTPPQDTSSTEKEKKAQPKKAAAQTEEQETPAQKKEAQPQEPSKSPKSTPAKSEDTQKSVPAEKTAKVDDKDSEKDSGKPPAKDLETAPVEKEKISSSPDKTPSEKEASVKSDKKETIYSDQSKSPNGGVVSSDSKTLPNGKVGEEENVSDVKPVIETAVADSKIASDSFFD